MSKKKIYILKTGPYNPEIKGLSKYESYDLITTQKYSPGISDRDYVKEHTDRRRIKNVEVILCSELKRTRKTAGVIKGIINDQTIRMVPTHLLNEVKFSMKVLVTEEEYKTHGSNIVRERFIEHFIADTLLESRKEIFERIQNLMELLNDRYRGKKVLCVSHSFFMKILSVYLKDKKLFEDPRVLKKYLDPKKRTFGFCEGFEFTV